MEDLYPPIEPAQSGWLEAGDGHRLYFEECGNLQGAPVLFLHGGPGSSSNPGHRRFFDPSFYRIVLFDQRGCGRSTPSGETHANTTADLLEDIERLRRHLGLERWLLFGGSWGSALALAYSLPRAPKWRGTWRVCGASCRKRGRHLPQTCRKRTARG
jgi:proline iminopeptidase